MSYLIDPNLFFDKVAQSGDPIDFNDAVNKIFTDPFSIVLDPLNKGSDKLTKGIAKSFKNLTGQKGEGLLGLWDEGGNIVSKNVRDLFNASINNVNPLAAATIGVGALAILIIAWKIP